MTHTLSSIRSWRTDELTDVAEAVKGVGEDYEKQLRESDRSLDRLVEGWHGAAARAAEQRVTTEIRFGRRLAHAVDRVERATRGGTHRLWSVRHTLLAKVADAVADQLAVSDDFVVTDVRPAGPTPPTTDEAAARQGVLDGHVHAISAALTTLTTEDKQVAFAIDNALDELRATTEDVRTGDEYLPPRSPVGMTAPEVAALVGSAEYQQWMRDHPDAAKQFLDSAVDHGLLDGQDPAYTKFLEDYWQQQAFDAAGIDPSVWDPSKGAAANSETITKVYEYYGQLYLDHPELAWAGMANLIGPSFAGGFYDLSMLRSIAQGVQDGTDRVPDLPGQADDAMKEMLDQVAGMSDSELQFYESTLLGMQKEIFTDQASLHEAYLLGGTDEIDRLRGAGVIDPSTRDAWHDIDSGDPARVEAGNDQLLHREQWDIIADDYDTMRDHPGTGEAVTWLITAVGAPSIPGAHGYSDVFPQVVDLGHTPDHVGPIPVPSADLGEVVTPLPDGNISDRDDRWALITDDTLPTYKDLLQHHPDQLRTLVGSDFDGRVDDARMIHHVDDVVEHFLTDWEYRR